MSIIFICDPNKVDWFLSQRCFGPTVVVAIPMVPTKARTKTVDQFIETIGDQLIGWFDNHQAQYWQPYQVKYTWVHLYDTPTVAEKITPELAAQLEPRTIIAGATFDGVISALKLWLGCDPYPGATDDVIASVSGTGVITPTGQRYLKAFANGLRAKVVRYILAELLDSDQSATAKIDAVVAKR